jgi:chorismate mutase/prephenate dehydratase
MTAQPKVSDPRATGPRLVRDDEDALAAARARLAAIDAELVALVATRQAVAREVGAIKVATGAPVLDPAREAAVLRRAAELARGHGLDEADVRDLWRKLLAMARRAQTTG